MLNLTTLLLQICLILLISRGLGWVFRKLHQPQVIGEMIAGIILGPSLLGWLAPSFSSELFPPESLNYISVLSQVGLIIFMFLVGLELDIKMLRKYANEVIIISNASILVPFFLGIIVAIFLYPVLSNGNVTSIAFALFIGAAMSITAFPVLARILEDHNLLNTKLGTIVIACAAINDVSGWCILAGLLLFLKSTSSHPLWMTLSCAFIFFCTMYIISRILPHIIERKFFNQNRISQDIVAIFLLLVLTSSLITEWLGIYPLFGAFLVGVITPRQNGFNHILRDKLYDMTVVLLLPIFFALTGLRTSIMVLNDEKMWFYCGLIIVVAIIGKFGGSAITAHLAGMSWQESRAVGILMNTRGLMELILLNIGLEYGLISRTVFTMFVLMTVFTTLITTPFLKFFYTNHLNQNECSNKESNSNPQISHS